MKNAIIFHGTGGNPNFFWFPYVKDELEQRGYTVWVPQLPNPDEARLSDWLPFVLENGHFDEGTVLIGHSAGCPLIFSILENIDIKIKQAVLVAGISEPLPGEVPSIFQSNYDWEKIKANCVEFIHINSDNDPWGWNNREARKTVEKVGGIQIIMHDGHFGSEKFNQPYKEFPLLAKLID